MSYTQLVQLGQILSDEPKVMGCLGFQIIVHPHLGDPLGGDQSPTCVRAALWINNMILPSWSTATWRFFSHWWLWWLFSPATLWSQGSEYSVQGFPRVTTPAHLQWVALAPPAILPAGLHQHQVLGLYSLISLTQLDLLHIGCYYVIGFYNTQYKSFTVK